MALPSPAPPAPRISLGNSPRQSIVHEPRERPLNMSPVNDIGPLMPDRHALRRNQRGERCSYDLTRGRGPSGSSLARALPTLMARGLGASAFARNRCWTMSMRAWGPQIRVNDRSAKLPVKVEVIDRAPLVSDRLTVARSTHQTAAQALVPHLVAAKAHVDRWSSVQQLARANHGAERAVWRCE